MKKRYNEESKKENILNKENCFNQKKLFCNTLKVTQKTDPLGSYTGKCENPYEEPVQDEDDL